MWRSALVLAFSCLLAAPILAGPNTGGTLVVHDVNLPVSGLDPSISVCNQGTHPIDCSQADTRLDGSGPANHKIWRVYAAFPPGCSPRLMGITWGVHYDPSLLVITNEATRSCGYWELNDASWPNSDTGSTVVWNGLQTASLIPVYCFSGYSYAATTFDLIGHPTQGGQFGDDTVPAILDPIAGYGRLGFGMDGSVVCPAVTALGACCGAEGGCTLTCPGACLSPSNWEGQWTSCYPDPCPQYPGACCDPGTGGCLFIDQAACLSPKTWLGSGITCLPLNPCAQPGICCNPADGACSLVLRINCLAPLSWYGAGSSCTPNPCPQLGACCTYPQGQCSLTLSVYCSAPSIWHGAWTSCSPNPCPPWGRCCNPANGSCAIRVSENCAAPLVWHPEWTACSPNPCPQIGACCDPETGACAVVLAAGCLSPGVWHSGWNSCSPNPCPQRGACCTGVTCTFVIRDLCGGSWYPLACDPDPCNAPGGACCDPATGVCLLIPELFCASPSVWHGDWAACTPNPCPQPSGACCTPHGACVVTLASGCSSPNTWLGLSTTCDANPCPQAPALGACCFTMTGECVTTLAEECVPPGLWFGWLTCSPNICPVPVPVQRSTWGRIKASYR
jgi:hypothetical protein